MKSAVFYNKHNLKLEEKELPKIEKNEVLIKTEACGICGTDVHIYEGDPGAADVTKPTILGHEFSGTVCEIGEDVKTLKVGDKVCVDPNLYCTNCKPCKDGHVHFCENMLSYGVTLDGGFAEYCAVNERVVYKIPDNVSFEDGAMVEPLACCLHGIDMCEIKPGDNVVIIGGGMIGLIMLQLAKIEGAAKIALLEPVLEKREVALKLGAAIALDPINQDVKKELLSNGFDRVSTVIECVGRVNTTEMAIDIAGYKSVVMIFGLTKPDESISLKPFDLFKKELVLKSSFINPLTHQRAIDLISNKKVDVNSMICDVIGLSDLENVLKDPNLRAKGKYLVSPTK